MLVASLFGQEQPRPAHARRQPRPTVPHRLPRPLPPKSRKWNRPAEIVCSRRASELSNRGLVANRHGAVESRESSTSLPRIHSIIRWWHWRARSPGLGQLTNQQPSLRTGTPGIWASSGDKLRGPGNGPAATCSPRGYSPCCCTRVPRYFRRGTGSVVVARRLRVDTGDGNPARTRGACASTRPEWLGNATAVADLERLLSRYPHIFG